MSSALNHSELINHSSKWEEIAFLGWPTASRAELGAIKQLSLGGNECQGWSSVAPSFLPASLPPPSVNEQTSQVPGLGYI